MVATSDTESQRRGSGSRKNSAADYQQERRKQSSDSSPQSPGGNPQPRPQSSEEAVQMDPAEQEQLRRFLAKQKQENRKKRRADRMARLVGEDGEEEFSSLSLSGGESSPRKMSQQSSSSGHRGTNSSSGSSRPGGRSPRGGKQVNVVNVSNPMASPSAKPDRGSSTDSIEDSDVSASGVQRSCFPLTDVDAKGDPIPLITCCCSDAALMDTTAWEMQRRRMHGLHRPFHGMQITAWLVTGLIVAFYFSAVVPGYVHYLRQDEKLKGSWIANAVPLIAVGALLTVGTAVTMFTTMLIDVTDYGTTGVRCDYCNFSTLPNSKHCKACNRCVADFDHHCKWLNTCIGGRNYRWFISFLMTTTLAIGYVCASSIFVLSRAFWEFPSLFEQIFGIVTVILSGLALFPVAQLLGFHLILIKNNMTTYQYIVKQRALQRREQEGEGGSKS